MLKNAFLLHVTYFSEKVARALVTLKGRHGMFVGVHTKRRGNLKLVVCPIKCA
jgi:DNA-binding cell septation regulator SpoVG